VAATFVAGEATPIAQLGFDDEPTPPWVIVPANGSRLVVLKDGTGLSIHLRTNPGTSAAPVKFQEQGHTLGRGILLTGERAGTAFLEALDAANTARATLEITVKERKTLSVCFIGIFDKSHRGPGTGLKNAEQIVEVCNKLYRPQANLELSHKASKGVALTFDMPTGLPTIFPPFAASRSWDRNTPGPLTCISSRPPGSFGTPQSGIPFCILEDRVIPPMRSADDLEALRRTQILINVVVHLDKKTDYSIFFVKVLDQHAGSGGLVGFTGAFTPKTPNGVAINACFMQDSAATGHNLAHELGHFLLDPPAKPLDSDGHSHVRGHLMFPQPGPLDIKIPKSQANMMNKSGNP